MMKKYPLTKIEYLQHKLDKQFGKGLFKAAIVVMLFNCFFFISCTPEKGTGQSQSSETVIHQQNPRTPNPRIEITHSGQTATINPDPYMDDDLQCIRSVYLAKKNVTEQHNAPLLGFTKLDSAHPQEDENQVVLPYDSILGKTVYLVIETNNMEGLSIDAVFRPVNNTLTGDTSSLELIRCNPVTNQSTQVYPHAYMQNYVSTTLFTAQVGDMSALNNNRGGIQYVNMDQFRHCAIIKLQLRPRTRTIFDTWARNLGQNSVNLEVVVERTDNEPCAYGDDDEEVLGAGVFLNDDADARFRIVNKNIFEIYHADNMYNFSRRYNPRDNLIIAKRVAKVLNHSTDEVVYYYLNQLDNEYRVCTRDKITVNCKIRQNTIPAIARRGNHIRTVDYSANRAAGENIDAIQLELYDNGTLGIHYSSTLRNNSNDRWYANQADTVELVDMNVIGTTGMGAQIFEEMNYDQNDIVMRYGFHDTRRRHTQPALFAGFLGAIAQFRDEGHLHYIVSNGFTYEDGSCFPSTGHVDGQAADLYYLNIAGDGGATLLQSADFDYDNQIIFCNILDDYGFTDTISENFSNRSNQSTGDDGTTILPNSRHFNVVRHNNHLHIGGFQTIEDIYDI